MSEFARVLILIKKCKAYEKRALLREALFFVLIGSVKGLFQLPFFESFKQLFSIL